jgi:hypothetical protein
VSDEFVTATLDTAAIRKHRQFIIQSEGYKSFLKVHEEMRRVLDSFFRPRKQQRL